MSLSPKSIVEALTTPIVKKARMQMDYVSNCNFYLDGVSTGVFSGVEGLTNEVEMIEYRCADNPTMVRYRPGMPKATRITLKRGFITHFDMNLWLEAAAQGNYM